MDFRIGEQAWRAGPAPLQPLPEGSPLHQHAKMLLSFDALLNSILALREQWRTYPSHITRFGFNPGVDYEGTIAKEGSQRRFNQILAQMIAMYVDGPKAVAWPVRGNSAQWQALADLIAECRRRGIELTIVTYPYHASMLVAFDRTGLQPAFEAWQVRLADLSARSAVPLWLFSRLTPESIEPPVPAGAIAPSRFYWEVAHFRPRLGDRVIRTIAGRDVFGVRLTPQNVMVQIAAERRALEVYKRDHPAVVRQIDGLIAAEAQRRAGAP